jgi:uncharacterized membrane protein YsdA (DUF1294 family)
VHDRWILIGVTAAYAVMSLATLIAYGWDKRRAVQEGPRVRERTLHLMEFFFGWPGALVGRMLFKHKRRKFGFSIITFLIAIFHIAVWCMAYWMYTQGLW